MEKFHIPKDRYSVEILTWCYDNFGGPTTGPRWDSYQHVIYSLNGQLMDGRIFTFYNDTDAIAFKLRWL